MTRRSYFIDLVDCPPLSAQDEAQLIERLKVEPRRSDQDLLITSNLRFVVAIASQFRGCGVPVEDLVNEGNLGLIEAVRRYDPRRGTRFLTYAVWWIRKAVLRAIAEQSVVRVPPYRRKQLKAARRVQRDLSTALERTPEQRMLAEKLSEAVSALDELRASTPRESRGQPAWFPQEKSVDELWVDVDARSPELEVLREGERRAGSGGDRRPLARRVAGHPGRFGLGGAPADSEGDRHGARHQPRARAPDRRSAARRRSGARSRREPVLSRAVDGGGMTVARGRRSDRRFIREPPPLHSAVMIRPEARWKHSRERPPSSDPRLTGR
jgi:RNA polymerase sigma factor (sigma-70 family)